MRIFRFITLGVILLSSLAGCNAGSNVGNTSQIKPSSEIYTVQKLDDGSAVSTAVESETITSNLYTTKVLFSAGESSANSYSLNYTFDGNKVSQAKKVTSTASNAMPIITTEPESCVLDSTNTSCNVTIDYTNVSSGEHTYYPSLTSSNGQVINLENSYITLKNTQAPSSTKQYIYILNSSKILKCDLNFANINNCEDQSSVLTAEISHGYPSIVMTSMIHDNSLFLRLADTNNLDPTNSGLYKCPINSTGDLGTCVAEPLVTNSEGSLSFVGKYAYQGGGAGDNGNPGAIIRYDYDPESSNIFSNRTNTHLFEASGEIPQAWWMIYSLGVGDYFITRDSRGQILVAKSSPLTGLLEVTDTVDNLSAHPIAHNGYDIYVYDAYATSDELIVRKLDKITGKIVATNSQSLPASSVDFGFGYAYYVDGSTNDVYTCKVSNRSGLLFDCNKASLNADFTPSLVAVYNKNNL